MRLIGTAIVTVAGRRRGITVAGTGTTRGTGTIHGIIADIMAGIHHGIMAMATIVPGITGGMVPVGMAAQWYITAAPVGQSTIAVL